MDDFVEKKLEEWGLTDKLQAIFEANEIDQDTFSKLTEADIKELIPVLGTRKKFEEKFSEYLAVIQAASCPMLITLTPSTGSQLSSLSDTDANSSVLSSSPKPLDFKSDIDITDNELTIQEA